MLTFLLFWTLIIGTLPPTPDGPPVEDDPAEHRPIVPIPPENPVPPRDQRPIKPLVPQPDEPDASEKPDKSEEPSIKPPKPPTPPRDNHRVESPPPPRATAICRCLKWDYEPHPVLSQFRFLVSRELGHYTDEMVGAGQAAVPELILELSCEHLHLFADGRYYVVAQAIALKGQHTVKDSKYSNAVCLQVRDRVLYRCSADPVTRGERCEESPESQASP